MLEDDAAIGQILEEMLVSLGYGVVRVATGQEALNAFEADRKGPQSLVGAILDLTIRGGLGGQEVLAGVRTLDDKFPVMVASGYSEAPVLANPSAHGFRAAIKKPYLREELVAALNLLW